MSNSLKALVDLAKSVIDSDPILKSIICYNNISNKPYVTKATMQDLLEYRNIDISTLSHSDIDIVYIEKKNYVSIICTLYDKTGKKILTVEQELDDDNTFSVLLKKKVLYAEYSEYSGPWFVHSIHIRYDNDTKEKIMHLGHGLHRKWGVVLPQTADIDYGNLSSIGKDPYIKETEKLARSIIANNIDSIVGDIYTLCMNEPSWSEENIEMRKERFLMKQKRV
jgi:hypothetical protein